MRTVIDRGASPTAKLASGSELKTSPPHGGTARLKIMRITQERSPESTFPSWLGSQHDLPLRPLWTARDRAYPVRSWRWEKRPRFPRPEHYGHPGA